MNFNETIYNTDGSPAVTLDPNPLLDIPEEWVRLVVLVRKIAPEALLAGGALRDLDLGAPVKDLDIFVDEASFEAVSKSVRMTHPIVSNKANLTSMEGEPDVTECVELSGLFGPPVNIIGLKHGLCTVAGVLNRFDFGICRMAFDGEHIHIGAAFVDDAIAHNFTLLRGDNEADVSRSLRRWERLKEKYPGWTLVRRDQYFKLEEFFADFDASESSPN